MFNIDILRLDDGEAKGAQRGTVAKSNRGDDVKKRIEISLCGLKKWF